MHGRLSLLARAIPNILSYLDAVLRASELHRTAEPAFEQIILTDGPVFDGDSFQNVLAAGHGSQELGPGRENRVHHKIVEAIVWANRVEAGLPCFWPDRWCAPAVTAGQQCVANKRADCRSGSAGGLSGKPGNTGVDRPGARALRLFKKI